MVQPNRSQEESKASGAFVFPKRGKNLQQFGKFQDQLLQSGIEVKIQMVEFGDIWF